MTDIETKTKSRVPLAWLARIWLGGIVLLLVVDWLSPGFNLGWLTRIYFWTTLAMSLTCLIAYGIDKRRANREKRRIPEKTLHLLEVLGGWPGAVLGQQMFRHKTVKMSFRLVLWTIILLHLALSSYFVYDAIRDKQQRQQILEDASKVGAVRVQEPGFRMRPPSDTATI